MTVDIATLAIRIDSLEARAAARDLDRVGSASQRASQQGEALTGVMGKLAGVFATIKLVEGANALLESQRAFDKLNASLITATGSVQGATKAFEALQDFAAKTPFGLQEVTKAFIQLRNLGLTPSERALNSYGNTASAMSKSLNQMVEAVADAATGEFERLKEFGIKAKQNGDQVSLTFQGVTTNIANNAATIEKYLIELGETKFGGGMALQAKTLDGAISNLGDAWEALKRTISQAGFGEAAHAAVLRLSAALAEMTAQVKEGGPMIEGLKAGAKVAAAYFAIFVAAPVAITAASTALAILYGIVGTGTARLLGAATATQALNTALYGTSVAAQLAAGTLTKLQVAASLLFAAFAGWEIGKYLEAQFVQARVVGEVFAGAILEAWENIRYGAVMSWEAVKFAFNTSIGAMKNTFADFLSSTAKGLNMVGATDTGDAIAKYAEGLRAAAGSQTDFARGTALITAGHNATIKNIQDETTARVNQALVEDRVSQAETKQTGDRLAGEAVKKAAAAQSAEAAKKAAAEYAASIKAANEFITGLKVEASEIGLTADQVKMMAAARAAAKAPTAELRVQIMEAALALDIETKAFAASEAARKSVADATQVLTDNRAAEYAAIAAEVKANNDAIATYGLSKAAIEALTLARMQDRLARRGPQDLDLDEAEVKHLERMIALQKEKAATTTTLGGLDTGSSVTQAKELLDILVAVDNAAKSAAQGMADSFGRVGSAIGGLTTAMTGYAVQQQAIAAQLAAVKADPKSSAQKIAQAEITASKASAQAQIKSYGDMAGAAKGFFKENTAGYKVLQTTEKAFRAYEMAMALESMVKKIFFKEGEVAANVALNATKITGEATATGASVALAGTEASAWGITAVVKAMASLPFPLNLAAGAVTLAAVLALGAKVMGGGGGGGFDVAKDRQEKAGTGSVLGDESAKSDSIGRSIENLEKYASVELSHTRDMLSALVKIRDTIGVVAAMASQTAGLRATALDEKKYGVGSSSGVLGIGASSTTIQDSGIKLNGSQTIGSAIASGVDATGYADILKKKSGFFGIGSSSKTSRDVIQLDDDLKKQFGLLVGSMRDGAVEAVKLLGVSADGIVEKINGMALGIDEISFKGLTGEEIEEQLQAVFSKVGDDIAKLAAPELTQFQQVGEGYLETLTRIATNYATLDSIMESSGVSFGAVGLSSIAARENLIKLTGGLDALTSRTESFNDNFLTEAERLAPVQKYVTDQLAAMGLQSLDTRDKFKDYVLGLTKSGALLVSGDITTRSQEQYAALLALSEAFAKTHAATVDLTKSEQEIADERMDLQDKLDELTMTQAQLAAKARDAIDGHNLALYDQVIAAQAAKEAAEAASQAAIKASQDLLTAVNTAFNGVTASVNAQKKLLESAHKTSMEAMQAQIDKTGASVTKLKSLSDALAGAISSIRGQSGTEADDRQSGQAQIAAALAIARASGVLPTADSLKDALAAVSKDASDQFSSFTEYQRSNYQTAMLVSDLADLTDSQLSVEQRMLDVLNAQKELAVQAYQDEVARLDSILETAKTQIDLLNGINTGIASIPAALAALANAIAQAQANPIVSATTSINKSYQEGLGRAPDKAGLEFWQQQAANGGSLGAIDAAIKGSGEAKIQDLYKNLLGRSADSVGLDYWLKALNSGASLSNIEASIKADAEYKKLHPFAVGTNYVPGDMPALIHEGERIIPKADNRELMARLSRPEGDNSELVAEVRELRNVVESHLYAIAKSARNTEDFLDGAINGGTPIAVREAEAVE